MQILSDLQFISDEYRATSPQTVFELSGYAGGTWTLQRQAPDGEWADEEAEFDGNGARFVKTIVGRTYRLRLIGKRVGALAWASDWIVDA